MFSLIIFAQTHTELVDICHRPWGTRGFRKMSTVTDQAILVLLLFCFLCTCKLKGSYSESLPKLTMSLGRLTTARTASDRDL
jgi:hypothetical protein